MVNSPTITGIENDTQQYRVATRKVSENATTQT